MSSNVEILALIERLKSGISNAPIEEIQNIIFDDIFNDASVENEFPVETPRYFQLPLDLNLEVRNAYNPDQFTKKSKASDSPKSIPSICQTARDAIDDLQICALLGDKEAIELSVDLAKALAHQVNNWITNPPLGKDDSVNDITKKTKTENECGLEAINTSANELLNFDDDRLREVNSGFESMPIPSFSFPISPILEDASPPSPRVSLVSSLCDKLIQKRLNSQCIQHTHKLARNSTIWPVTFSAYQYARNHVVSHIQPNLNLGSSFDVDFSTENRSIDGPGPAAIAMEFFLTLERERMKSRSASHLAEFKRADEDADENLELKTPYKTGIVTTGISQSNPIWNASNSWLRKAALLEPLENSTVGEWVTAAYYLAASKCNGDFTDYPWSASINKSIVATGSPKAGFNRILVQGFRSIIKNGKNLPTKTASDSDAPSLK